MRNPMLFAQIFAMGLALGTSLLIYVHSTFATKETSEVIREDVKYIRDSLDAVRGIKKE